MYTLVDNIWNLFIKKLQLSIHLQPCSYESKWDWLAKQNDNLKYAIKELPMLALAPTWRLAYEMWLDFMLPRILGFKQKHDRFNTDGYQYYYELLQQI